jgi:hypothetical protein
MKSLLAFIYCLSGLVVPPLFGQGINVPVYRQGRQENQEQAALIRAAEALRATGKPVAMSAVGEQLRRTSCSVELPPVNTRQRQSEIWQRVRAATCRIGWSYLCNKCEH